MQYVKQCFSADISKKELVCRWGILNSQHEIELGPGGTFENSAAGLKQMYAWVQKVRKKELPCLFIMEATGVYHENLAHFLHGEGEKVCVELPTRVKKFAQSLPHKSKTDPIDAKMLCRLGLERTHTLWNPPDALFKMLRSLGRELEVSGKFMTQIQNQIHALQSSHQPLKSTLKRLEKRLKEEAKNKEAIKQEIQELVASDPGLEEKVNRIATIPGLGWQSVVGVIAETNGFAMIENRKQLASYAGLDIQQNESGVFKGKTRISKKGNRVLRKILFMPALSACRYNPSIKALHIRIKESSGIPKKGVIAAARKLLLLIYALWKNGQTYQLTPNLGSVKIN